MIESPLALITSVIAFHISPFQPELSLRAMKLQDGMKKKNKIKTYLSIIDAFARDQGYARGEGGGGLFANGFCNCTVA